MNTKEEKEQGGLDFVYWHGSLKTNSESPKRTRMFPKVQRPKLYVQPGRTLAPENAHWEEERVLKHWENEKDHVDDFSDCSSIFHN